MKVVLFGAPGSGKHSLSEEIFPLFGDSIDKPAILNHFFIEAAVGALADYRTELELVGNRGQMGLEPSGIFTHSILDSIAHLMTRMKFTNDDEDLEYRLAYVASIAGLVAFDTLPIIDLVLVLPGYEEDDLGFNKEVEQAINTTLTLFNVRHIFLPKDRKEQQQKASEIIVEYQASQ